MFDMAIGIVSVVLLFVVGFFFFAAVISVGVYWGLRTYWHFEKLDIEWQDKKGVISEKPLKK